MIAVPWTDEATVAWQHDESERAAAGEPPADGEQGRLYRPSPDPVA